METLTPANSSTETNNNLSSAVWVSLLPDHTHLPDRDDNFVKNFQEHPQSIILTTSIEPVLAKLHPDGHYCIGQDCAVNISANQICTGHVAVRHQCSAQVHTP